MIYPFSIINRIRSKRKIWIQGDNGAGKTALALDIAKVFLEDNFRLVSNLNCVWNDDLPMELDTNLQLNVVCILDESGVYMRTKESIRLVMGAARKLNAYFLMPSSEAPHEDLWSAYIEPHERLNQWLVVPLFGQYFYDNYFKVWKYVTFHPKKGFQESIFFQFHPKAFYYLYSTLSFGTSPEDILSLFQQSLEQQNKLLGNENMVKFQDLATKRSGVGESSSFASQQVATYQAESQRRIQSSRFGRK